MVKKSTLIIFSLSLAVTIALFMHDYYYDDAEKKDSLQTMLLVGGIYAGLIFSALYLLNWLLRASLALYARRLIKKKK